MDRSEFYRGFVFEYEILGSLFIVATAPVDTALRLKATDMLRETVPRQEAAFDSRYFLRAAEHMMVAVMKD